MKATRACFVTATLFCAFGRLSAAEEASCPQRYDPRDGWLQVSECEKGDILAVSFEPQDEVDAPRFAAAFCELDGITLLRADGRITLICRYRGAQRRPREVIRQLDR